jgi:hypothetical protein
VQHYFDTFCIYTYKPYFCKLLILQSAIFTSADIAYIRDQIPFFTLILRKMVKSLLFIFLLPCILQAQNVGIGTTTPLMKWHASTNQSSLALLENTEAMSLGSTNALYFKIGSGAYPYTGAIKSIGQNEIEARLGFFTFAATDIFGLQERMSILDNGYVGIGTTLPSAEFHAIGRMQVTGDYGTGPDLELSGSGVRMFFYPKKIAFRAGSVNGTEWDHANIGDWSFAVGEDTKASAIRTTAFGSGSEATGAGATAMGNETTASGLLSTAMGTNTIAAGVASTSMGEMTNAGGQNTTAMGWTTMANGKRSTATGSGTIANGFASLVIGQYNDPIVSSEIAMQPATPLLIIGNGTADNARANIMVARNDGHIGLGTNAPHSTLQVNGSSATKVSVITGSITLDDTHGAILCNSTSPFTLNLPSAVGISGRQYSIKNISTGVVTVDANGSQTIDGAPTVLLSVKFGYVNLVSDGGNWFILSSASTFYIGQPYGGGKIAYLDATGQHGLIAAAQDITDNINEFYIWGCNGTNIPGADGTAIGTGMQNTLDIVAGCGDPACAAQLCYNLVIGEYTDWFLPSVDELLQVYINRDLIGGFVDISQPFTSSSEVDSGNAKFVNFNGGGVVTDQKFFLKRVRAVRAF